MLGVHDEAITYPRGAVEIVSLCLGEFDAADHRDRNTSVTRGSNQVDERISRG